MNEKSALGLFAILLLVVGFVGGYLVHGTPKQQALGGLIHNIQESFDAGIAVQGTQIIDSSGNVTTPSLTVNGGTAMTRRLKTTASVSPNTISNGGTTTTDVTLTGATVGDFVHIGLTGSWAAPSSSVMVRGSVVSANTVRLYFQNTSSTGVSLTPSTYVIVDTN